MVVSLRLRSISHEFSSGNVVALLNQFYTASANFCIHARNGPVVILNDLNLFIIDTTLHRQYLPFTPTFRIFLVMVTETV